MAQKAEMLPDDVKKVLKETFKDLKDKVLIEVFVKEEDQFSSFTTALMRGIATLTDKINLHFHQIGAETAKKRGITRAPVMLIGPDRYRITLTGAPMGEEGRTLVMAILAVSTGRTILSEAATRKLRELSEPRQIRVFVSPTCPYCPQQALNALSAAMARPDLVSAEIIEMYENRDYVDKYHIVTVPFTVVNDTPIGPGVRPPEVFAEEVLRLSSVEKAFTPGEGETVEADIVIIGGGPGGLTAAIYSGRSGLKTMVLERAAVGGQVLVTPVVENYPGFSEIAGKTLVDIMYQQALQYSHIFEGEKVVDLKKTGAGFELTTNRRTCRAKAVILASGAEHKKLEVSGEDSFNGRGVSYCATCDGYFFKDGKKVIVVGGGNTALTDALYLHSIGAHVSLVHRRDRLRAESFLQKSIEEKEIPVLWNTVVRGIVGDDVVTGVKLYNLKEDTVRQMPVDGVFVAIGYSPNNEVAKMLDLSLDQEGYITVDDRQRTSERLVYAVGDVTGGVKQIVTAVGQGAKAAITAFEDIANPYWKKGAE